MYVLYIYICNLDTYKTTDEWHDITILMQADLHLAFTSDSITYLLLSSIG